MSIATVTEENFESMVIRSELPFLVDFWADWCAPCHMMAPIIEEIAAENVGILRVGKLNVDEQAAIAHAYRIMSIPTLILFDKGQAVAAITGVTPKTEMMRLLSAHLTN